MQNKIKEENFKILTDHRKMLDKHRIESSNSLDKYLLSFATGSLYLSIFFTNELDKSMKCLCLLQTGWALLIISIISTLISMYVSVKAHEKEVENIDQKLVALDNDDEIKEDRNLWSGVVDLTNIISITTFIGGITFLTIFYFNNI